MTEAELRGDLDVINKELAALGLDPTLSQLQGHTYLPQNYLDHEEFDKRVLLYETTIAELEEKKSQYGKTFKNATDALKEVHNINPLLMRGDKVHIQRELLRQQEAAKGQLQEACRQLIATKAGLHNLYETISSIDVNEYHRALENILDRKIEIQKSLRAVMRL